LDFLLIFELGFVLVPLIILSQFGIEMQGPACNSAYRPVTTKGPNKSHMVVGITMTDIIVAFDWYYHSFCHQFKTKNIVSGNVLNVLVTKKAKILTCLSDILHIHYFRK